MILCFVYSFFYTVTLGGKKGKRENRERISEVSLPFKIEYWIRFCGTKSGLSILVKLVVYFGFWVGYYSIVS